MRARAQRRLTSLAPHSRAVHNVVVMDAAGVAAPSTLAPADMLSAHRGRVFSVSAAPDTGHCPHLAASTPRRCSTGACSAQLRRLRGGLGPHPALMHRAPTESPTPHGALWGPTVHSSGTVRTAHSLTGSRPPHGLTPPPMVFLPKATPGVAGQQFSTSRRASGPSPRPTPSRSCCPHLDRYGLCSSIRSCGASKPPSHPLGTSSPASQTTSPLRGQASGRGVPRPCPRSRR